MSKTYRQYRNEQRQDRVSNMKKEKEKVKIKEKPQEFYLPFSEDHPSIILPKNALVKRVIMQVKGVKDVVLSAEIPEAGTITFESKVSGGLEVQEFAINMEFVQGTLFSVKCSGEGTFLGQVECVGRNHA